jgi:hypothetical protein
LCGGVWRARAQCSVSRGQKTTETDTRRHTPSPPLASVPSRLSHSKHGCDRTHASSRRRVDTLRAGHDTLPPSKISLLLSVWLLANKNTFLAHSRTSPWFAHRS